jgi:hypothetical protein
LLIGLQQTLDVGVGRKKTGRVQALHCCTASASL